MMVENENRCAAAAIQMLNADHAPRTATPRHVTHSHAHHSATPPSHTRSRPPQSAVGPSAACFQQALGEGSRIRNQDPGGVASEETGGGRGQTPSQLPYNNTQV